MQWSWQSFVLGFIAATIVLGCAAAGGMGSLARTGVTVYVDPAPLLGEIETSLVREAEIQIHHLLGSVRQDLPTQVAREVAGTFRGLSFTVYDVQVPLPDEVIRRMELSLQDSLAAEVELWVEDVDWSPLMGNLTEATRSQVVDLLDDSAGWDLELNLPGPWSMPVYISSVP